MGSCNAHCLILPYPVQGHINPMIQFSKRLQHEGIKVTLAATESLSETIQEVSGLSISVEKISSGFVGKSIEDIELYFDTFKRVGSETLSEVVLKLQDMGCSVDCIIYDSVLPWAFDVAKKFGISGAAFFTQSCAVNNIYYHVHKGLLKVPLVEDEVRIPGLPPLASSDFPSFVADYGSYPPFFRLVVNQFLHIEKVDWLFINTIYELEDEVVDSMNQSLPAVRTIGPTIPSMYLDRRLQGDTEYGLNMFQPMTDACMTWLNERSEESVIYVAFGSLAALSTEQMEELAWGLRNSNKNFLWVVRKSEENKLPEGFVEETREKGMVVSWCPQLQVLAHKSIGCFMTHCGWNSTLEALSLGVPVVAVPQWTDQQTNAKFLMDVWKMGIKAQSDENGIVRRDVIEKCVREVSEGEMGKEFRKNANTWKELARKAMGEGGSSDQNIKEFASQMVLYK